MMRIDAHTHVFTLNSILSREAIRVITQRLVDTKGVPEALAEAVGDLLNDHINKPEYLDERRLLRKLLEKLLGVVGLDNIAGKLGDNHIVAALGGSLDDLAVEKLSDLITKVLDAHDGGPGDKVLDVIETLRQAMQPTITDVAKDILAPMDDDGVIVTLMMDIFAAPESGADRRRYLGQIDGTAEASLQLPGRLLPFFGIHPDRPGHLDELKRAVESKGFVGVKLYPSLGYKVDSPTMRKVYEYCLDKDLPVLLHCGHGGFYRTEDYIELCNPNQWSDVLKDYPNLRVCFAHFGGWEALGKQNCLGKNWPPPDKPGLKAKDNWGKEIYDFIRTYPNVYTDLAKHVTMFENDADRDMYFDTLQSLVKPGGELEGRILFGTDAWLLRLDMPFDKYWSQWKDASGGAWDAITIEGPMAFLGFNGADHTQWRGNLQRYLQYMEAQRHSVGQAPAPWLSRIITEPFTAGRDAPDWDRHVQAVRDTYQFLGDYLTRRQKDEGFVANRTRRLRDLSYFDPEDPVFDGRCRDMARRFVDFADQGVGQRDGHDFASCVDIFIDMFTRGDARLCDVAMTLNTVINYPELVV